MIIFWYCNIDFTHILFFQSSTKQPKINQVSLSLFLFQSYRILPELLQRFHVTDRYGLQRLLPSLLWPAGRLAHVHARSIHPFMHKLIYICRHAVHTSTNNMHAAIKGRHCFFIHWNLQNPTKRSFVCLVIKYHQYTTSQYIKYLYFLFMKEVSTLW